MANKPMNKMLLFNQNIIPCHYNQLYIQDLRAVLTDMIIADGYFFMQWLFPVVGQSKWHTHTQGLSNEDVNILHHSALIKENILKSTTLILNYFKLCVEHDVIYQKDNIDCNPYWLTGIGHEEKKLSRMMLSLSISGFDKLANNLQKTSIQLLADKGFKTGKDPQETILVWQTIFNEKILY